MTDDNADGGQAVQPAGKGSALKAMVSFFTIWHMDIKQEDIDEMERSFWQVPIVGLLFGVAMIVEVLILGLISKEWGYGSDLFTAVVVIATAYVGSKFIHFDGLTDFGDGMIVSGTQEDHVRALKDTLVGAGGIGVALVAVLMSVAIYGSSGLLLLVFAPLAEVLVKNAMVAAAAYGKPGHGMAGRQVSMTTTNSLVRSTVLSIILGVILVLVTAVIFDAAFSTPQYYGYSVIPEIDIVSALICLVFGVIASIVVGYLMARKANSVFGMVNGDILGATNEISRILVMFVMVMPYICWM